MPLFKIEKPLHAVLLYPTQKQQTNSTHKWYLAQVVFGELWFIYNNFFFCMKHKITIFFPCEMPFFTLLWCVIFCEARIEFSVGHNVWFCHQQANCCQRWSAGIYLRWLFHFPWNVNLTLPIYHLLLRRNDLTTIPTILCINLLDW